MTIRTKRVRSSRSNLKFMSDIIRYRAKYKWPKKIRWIKKKIHQFPTEVLAEIFQYLTPNSLLELANKCRQFRNAIGLTVRRNFCSLKKKLNETINNQTKILEEGPLSYNKQTNEWEIIKRLGYTRVLKFHMEMLDVLFGEYIYNNQTWNLIANQLIPVIEEQNDALSCVENYQYFFREVKSQYFNSSVPQLVKFYKNYFTKIEPLLRNIKNDAPYCIQLLNLLLFCQTSNLKMNVYHPIDCDISIIEINFELHGLDKRQCDINDLSEYTNENIPLESKLINFKMYFKNLIENENGAYLSNLMEAISNSHSQFDDVQSADDVLLQRLSNLYNTFLHETYKEINHKRIQLNSDNVKMYLHVLTREQEPVTCDSSVICNLTMSCSRKYLPDIIKFKPKNIIDESFLELEEQIDIVTDLTSRVTDLLSQLDNDINKWNDIMLGIICIKHKNIFGPVEEIIKTLELNILKKNKNKEAFKIIFDGSIAK